MRAVNLLPRDLTGDGRKAPPGPVIAGCVGVVLATALLAVLFLSASGDVASKKRQLAAVQAQYAAMPAPPTPSAAVKELPQTKATRVTALTDEENEQRFGDWANVLYDQSVLSMGEQLENPVRFVSRLNDLLAHL